MKGRIATVLSLTGVIVAGSAAALVNTQVLQSTESKSSGQVAVNSTDAASGEVTKIQSNVLTATQAMYQVRDAGLVTLDTAGDVLTIVSVTPASGWTVLKAENESSADIEVKLTNGTTVIEFKANLQLGVITTSVESKTLGITSVTTPGIGSIEDDDAFEDDDDDVSVIIGVEVDDSGHGGDDD